MRDTAPLAPPHDPAGRARPPFIRPVWSASGNATQLANSLGKFCPPKFCSRRDATLPADRQMTHFADVAPSMDYVSSPAGKLFPARRETFSRHRGTSRQMAGQTEPSSNVEVHQPGWQSFRQLLMRMSCSQPTRSPRPPAPPDRDLEQQSELP
jgi:hypothetical protein